MTALRGRQPPVDSQIVSRFHRRLAEAELDGRISEFYSLTLRCLAAIVEGSEFAGDYLAMAEAVASSRWQRRIVARTRLALERMQARPR